MTELTDLQKLAECAEDTSRHSFNAGDVLMPMWLVMTGDGNISCISTPFGSTAEKNAVDMYIKKFLKEKDAVCYVFAAEVWVRRVDPDKSTDLDIPPSEHPDRSEVIMITGEDRRRNRVWRTIPITRDGDTATLGDTVDEIADGMTTAHGPRFHSMFGKDIAH